MAMGTFMSAFDLVIRSTRARLDLILKFLSLTSSIKVHFLLLICHFFPVCSLYCRPFFPSSFSFFPLLCLSRCLSVTHLHLGSLGHGRGSSLDWAWLPLTPPCASDAGLHCLHLHTQHALFIYLYLLASP